MTREIFHVVTQLRDKGVAVLLVEQNARAALKISDYGYVLESGEISLEGPSAELTDDPRVVGSYLGLGGKTKSTTALQGGSA
jgi:branched-chain amino acid transport system ATP-binding protein